MSFSAYCVIYDVIGTSIRSTNIRYSESCIEPLATRRDKHKLTMYYKIKNNMTGNSLRELLPQSNEMRQNENLRNVNDYRIYRTRTSAYKKSFFPSTTLLWNNLPINVRNAHTVKNFKFFQNLNSKDVPKHFYIGKPKATRYHCRIRCCCSNLNHDLYLNHLPIVQTVAVEMVLKMQTTTFFIV